MENKIQNPSSTGIENGLMPTKVELKENILLWKKFLSEQAIIRFIDGKNNLQKFKNNFSFKESSFAVLFPRSFNHLKDFQKGLMSATAAAFFHKNASATLFGTNKTAIVTYQEALQVILESTTGKSLSFITSLEIPKENLEVQNIFEFQKTINHKIQMWINKFNSIPGVEAYWYEGNDVEKIIDVKILRSLDAFMNVGKPKSFEPEPPIVWFALFLNGTFKDYISESRKNAEEDSIYIHWKNELDASCASSWADLYHFVIKLVKQYEESIPALVNLL